jgi:hypothetical protein
MSTQGKISFLLTTSAALGTHSTGTFPFWASLCLGGHKGDEGGKDEAALHISEVLASKSKECGMLK